MCGEISREQICDIVSWQNLKTHRYKIAAFVVFTIYLASVLSMTIAISHYTPLNTISTENESDPQENATEILNKTGKRAGLTVGDLDKPFKKQIGTFSGYLITSLPFLLSVSLLALLLLLVFSKQSEDSNSILGLSQLLRFVVGIVLYIFSVVLILRFLPQVHFIDVNGNSRTIFWALSRDKMVMQFWILLFLQAAIINSVLYVWTRPVLPAYLNSRKKRALTMHLNNWRKYGSWLATVLGGVLLTSILVFITNTTQFGSFFIQHVLILVGGAVILDLLFIVFKLYRIEHEVATKY